MFLNYKVVVVLPAYNASKTIAQTIHEIPKDIVDELILTDDFSTDNTVEIAAQLGIHHILKHELNLGYGANQKTCYQKALELEADIIVMLHPDYQYTPKLITAMVSMIANQTYDVVLASRILGNGAIKGGMPIHKYFINRLLTFIQNILLSEKLSEYHTGYRAFNKTSLSNINYLKNSNNFIFDNEILAQLFYNKYRIGELSCPTHYFKEASTINLKQGIIYAWGVLMVSIKYRLHKWKFIKYHILEKKGCSPTLK